MHFQLLVLTCIFATSTLATPLTTRTDVISNPQTKYVELYRENATASNGHLIYYGPDGEAPAQPNSLKERAASCTSTGTVTCSAENVGFNDPCNIFIQELYHDMAATVPSAPRQICFSGNAEVHGYCCVSWSKPIPGLKKGDLFNVAYTMYHQCTFQGLSGKTSNVNVDGICLNVCWSDRGKHCS